MVGEIFMVMINYKTSIFNGIVIVSFIYVGGKIFTTDGLNPQFTGLRFFAHTGPRPTLGKVEPLECACLILGWASCDDKYPNYEKYRVLAGIRYIVHFYLLKT